MQKNLWHMWVHPHGVDTTGALDLGGASTQISFVAEEKTEPNASDTVQVSLYGYTYTLYTHSFQCYGRNEAEKKFLAMLLQVPGWEGLRQGGGLRPVSILTPICSVDRNNTRVSCSLGVSFLPLPPVSLSSSVVLTNHLQQMEVRKTREDRAAVIAWWGKCLLFKLKGLSSSL